MTGSTWLSYVTAAGVTWYRIPPDDSEWKMRDDGSAPLGRFTAILRGDDDPPDPKSEMKGKKRANPQHATMDADGVKRPPWRTFRKRDHAELRTELLDVLEREHRPQGRTMNHLTLVAWGFTADVADEPAQDLLWALVADGLVEWTQPAPIRFRLRRPT